MPRVRGMGCDENHGGVGLKYSGLFLSYGEAIEEKPRGEAALYAQS
jgi:hypothetical protein